MRTGRVRGAEWDLVAPAHHPEPVRAGNDGRDPVATREADRADDARGPQADPAAGKGSAHSSGAGVEMVGVAATTPTPGVAMPLPQAWSAAVRLTMIVGLASLINLPPLTLKRILVSCFVEAIAVQQYHPTPEVNW